MPICKKCKIYAPLKDLVPYGVQVSCLALFFLYIGLRVFMQLLNLECDVIGGLITPVHSLKLS